MRAFGFEDYDSAWQREREQLRLRWRCEESGVPPVEAALRLGGAKLSARERHGLENFFVLEGGFYIRALGLGASALPRCACVVIVANAIHRYSSPLN
jgi:hypothetical protein